MQYDASAVGSRTARSPQRRIDDQTVDAVKRRTDIVEVVSRHVELKRAGANLTGLCPFHAEKSASFNVSPQRGTYHCFGCGVSGDAIQFLMEMEGSSFLETIEDLAQAAGIAVETTSADAAPRAPRPNKDEAQAMTEALASAAVFYQAELQAALDHPRTSGWPEFAAEAADYVRSRGIDQRTIEHFGIGLAAPLRNGLRAAFPGHYDGNRLLMKVDLVRQVERPVGTNVSPATSAAGVGATGAVSARRLGFGSPAGVAQAPAVEMVTRDTFRRRLLFPVRNPAGKVVAFGGRKFEDGNKANPKYLNSADTPLFNKTSILYGLHEARQAIRSEKFALMVEGYMDVVMLWQYDFRNAVATMGTACTEEHLRTLLHFTDAVVFMFDGDAAGRAAARKTAEAALPLVDSRHDIRILILPDQLDPDEFLKTHGAEALRTLIQSARSLSMYLRDELVVECRGMKTPEERARYTMKFQTLLKLMSRDSPLSKEYWKLFQGSLNAVTGEGWQPRGRPSGATSSRAAVLGSQTSVIAKLREAIVIAPDVALEMRDDIAVLLDTEDAAERGLLQVLDRIGIDTSSAPATTGSAEWMFARDLIASHANLFEGHRKEQLRAALKLQRDTGEISLGEYLSELRALA